MSDVFPRVGVVADDITGAGDIGVMFAKAGCAVRIFSAQSDRSRIPAQIRGVRTDVVIIDTDSRYDSAELAAEKVRRATAALRACGAERFIKKTCSVFRGNVGAEFDAMLDALGETFGVAIAAFPKNGRKTIEGMHWVHGRPLSESEFARDPIHPRNNSNLVLDLRKQTARRVELLSLAELRAQDAAERLAALRSSGVAYVLCDAETQEDISVLASLLARERVLLGSSAIAEELPCVRPRPAPFSPWQELDIPSGTGVLVIAGSAMPQTREQLAALARQGVAFLEVDGVAALDQPELEARRALDFLVPRLGRNEVAGVRLRSGPEDVARMHDEGVHRGMKPEDVSRALSALLGDVARQAVTSSRCARLLTLGGDTSAAVCRALSIHQTVVLQEIAPGLPSSVSVGALPLLLVLKSGSFGGPDFGIEAVQHLKSLPQPVGTPVDNSSVIGACEVETVRSGGS